MIRFGIKFDDFDCLKVFVSELSKYHSLVDCDYSDEPVLYFRLKCSNAFHASLLIQEIRTIIRNLGFAPSANMYLVTFCHVVE